jgi:two-component SAPR family response regulator
MLIYLVILERHNQLKLKLLIQEAKLLLNDERIWPICLLKRFDHKVMKCSRLATSLLRRYNQFNTFKLFIVLIDIRIPGITGDLAENLNGIDSDIKIILMTVFGCVDTGNLNCIQKSIPIPGL